MQFVQLNSRNGLIVYNLMFVSSPNETKLIVFICLNDWFGKNYSVLRSIPVLGRHFWLEHR